MENINSHHNRNSKHVCILYLFPEITEACLYQWKVALSVLWLERSTSSYWWTTSMHQVSLLWAGTKCCCSCSHCTSSEDAWRWSTSNCWCSSQARVHSVQSSTGRGRVL